jgi:hypothetical protein
VIILIFPWMKDYEREKLRILEEKFGTAQGPLT